MQKIFLTVVTDHETGVIEADAYLKERAAQKRGVSRGNEYYDRSGIGFFLGKEGQVFNTWEEVVGYNDSSEYAQFQIMDMAYRVEVVAVPVDDKAFVSAAVVNEVIDGMGDRSECMNKIKSFLHNRFGGESVEELADYLDSVKQDPSEFAAFVINGSEVGNFDWLSGHVSQYDQYVRVREDPSSMVEEGIEAIIMEAREYYIVEELIPTLTDIIEKNSIAF